MKTRIPLLILLLVFPAVFILAQTEEIENLVREGIEYHDRGEYGKVITIYQKALELDPESSLAHYEIAYS